MIVVAIVISDRKFCCGSCCCCFSRCFSIIVVDFIVFLVVGQSSDSGSEGYGSWTSNL